MALVKKGKWIGGIGDICPFEHGGGHVYYSDGIYTLWYTPGIDDWLEEWDKVPGWDKTVEVYRVDIHKSADEFRDWFNWVTWHAVADIVGQTAEELLSYTDTVMGRASVVECVAGYYGWLELDVYPERYTNGQLGNQKW